MNTEEKERQLLAIAREIEKCRLCRKGKHGKAVPGEGNPNAKIVFLGEAPGKEEAKTGRPFIGRSGKLLRSLIRGVGLREADVFITSPVKYLPDRGTPSSSDIEHGRVHLLKQLKVIDPNIIVLLGNVACKGILNEAHQVLKEHGSVITKEGKKYFITLHPAAAIRFKKYVPIIEKDFHKFRQLL